MSLFKEREARLRKFTTKCDRPLYKYDPSQPRAQDGKWTDGGGSGSGSGSGGTGSKPKGSGVGRAAALAGTAALAVGAAALAIRNPAAAAQALLRGVRTADRYTGNLPNRAMFGGGGIAGKRTAVGTVSRSKLATSAFNISTGKQLTPALHKRFGDVDIVIKRPHGNTMELTIKSKSLASLDDAALHRMHGTGDTALIKNSVYFSATVDTKAGNVLGVKALYAPDTMAGQMFTQKAFTTVRDLAVANNADVILTPAGWSMGGYLWPNAGFQLLGAGNPPVSLGLRAAGAWEDFAITATSVKAIVEYRAKELFAHKAISRADYGKVLAHIDDINWGPDSAAIISNMSSKVNIDGIKLLGMPHTAVQREIRGDVTLGKALLTHTNGTYILPKHLYERMFTITKRAPPQRKTLYVCRKLLNAGDLIRWAKAQGIKTTLLPDDMHVTIAYSKTPLAWPTAEDNTLTVRNGVWKLKRLGDEGEAVVLAFNSKHLHQRWRELCNLGASWDWNEYQPHITISYKVDSFDLGAVRPYTGPLIFGPEEFDTVDSDKEHIEKYDENQPRDEGGRWSSSGGGVARAALIGAAGAALGTVGTLALLRAGQAARVANRAARLRDIKLDRFAREETARLDARLARHMEPRGPVSRGALRMSEAMDRAGQRIAGSRAGQAVGRKLPKRVKDQLREFSRNPPPL